MDPKPVHHLAMIQTACGCSRTMAKPQDFTIPEITVAAGVSNVLGKDGKPVPQYRRFGYVGTNKLENEHMILFLDIYLEGTPPKPVPMPDGAKGH